MNSKIRYLFLNRLLFPFSLVMGLLMLFIPVKAQENPPKPITVKVRNYQPLTFGTFIQSGTNGNVTISPQGARTATGGVILPNINSITTAALFDVESIPGTLITIQNGPNTLLGGSHGGTMTLTIGGSDPPSPFITTGEHTLVTIGGTLAVGSLSANPAGEYSGTFQVTFIQQ